MSNTKEILNELINKKVKSFFNENNIVKGIYRKLINQIEDLKNKEDLLKFKKPKFNDIKALIDNFENNDYKLEKQHITQMNNALKEGHKINGGSLLVKITDFLKSNDNGKYDYIERIKEEIENKNNNIVNVIIDNQSIRTKEDNNDLFSLNKDDLIKFTESLNIEKNEIKSDISNSQESLKFYIDKFIIENLKKSIFNLTKNESSNEIKELEEQINSLERLGALLNFGTVYFKTNQDLYYSDGKERAKAGDILNYSLGDLISKVINNIGNKTDDEIKEYIESIFLNNGNFLSIKMLTEIETQENIEFIKEYKIDKDNKTITIKLVDHINSLISNDYFRDIIHFFERPLTERTFIKIKEVFLENHGIKVPEVNFLKNLSFKDIKSIENFLQKINSYLKQNLQRDNFDNIAIYLLTKLSKNINLVKEKYKESIIQYFVNQVHEKNLIYNYLKIIYLLDYGVNRDDLKNHQEIIKNKVNFLENIMNESFFYILFEKKEIGLFENLLSKNPDELKIFSNFIEFFYNSYDSFDLKNSPSQDIDHLKYDIAKKIIDFFNTLSIEQLESLNADRIAKYIIIKKIINKKNISFNDLNDENFKDELKENYILNIFNFYNYDYNNLIDTSKNKFIKINLTNDKEDQYIKLIEEFKLKFQKKTLDEIKFIYELLYSFISSKIYINKPLFYKIFADFDSSKIELIKKLINDKKLNKNISLNSMIYLRFFEIYDENFNIDDLDEKLRILNELNINFIESLDNILNDNQKEILNIFFSKSKEELNNILNIKMIINDQPEENLLKLMKLLKEFSSEEIKKFNKIIQNFSGNDSLESLIKNTLNDTSIINFKTLESKLDSEEFKKDFFLNAFSLKLRFLSENYLNDTIQKYQNLVILKSYEEIKTFSEIFQEIFSRYNIYHKDLEVYYLNSAKYFFEKLYNKITQEKIKLINEIMPITELKGILKIIFLINTNSYNEEDTKLIDKKINFLNLNIINEYFFNYLLIQGEIDLIENILSKDINELKSFVNLGFIKPEDTLENKTKVIKFLISLNSDQLKELNNYDDNQKVIIYEKIIEIRSIEFKFMDIALIDFENELKNSFIEKESSLFQLIENNLIDENLLNTLQSKTLEEIKFINDFFPKNIKEDYKFFYSKLLKDLIKKDNKEFEEIKNFYKTLNPQTEFEKLFFIYSFNISSKEFRKDYNEKIKYIKNIYNNSEDEFIYIDKFFRNEEYLKKQNMSLIKKIFSFIYIFLSNIFFNKKDEENFFKNPYSKSLDKLEQIDNILKNFSNLNEIDDIIRNKQIQFDSYIQNKYKIIKFLNKLTLEQLKSFQNHSLIEQDHIFEKILYFEKMNESFNFESKSFKQELKKIYIDKNKNFLFKLIGSRSLEEIKFIYNLCNELNDSISTNENLIEAFKKASSNKIKFIKKLQENEKIDTNLLEKILNKNFILNDNFDFDSFIKNATNKSIEKFVDINSNKFNLSSNEAINVEKKDIWLS